MQDIQVRGSRCLRRVSGLGSWVVVVRFVRFIHLFSH